MVNCQKKKKQSHNTHGLRLGRRVPLYLPPDKYVTGLFPSEVIIVLQYYFVCIPNNHPELISGEGRRKEDIRHTLLDFLHFTVNRALTVPTHSPSFTLLIKLTNLPKKAQAQLTIYIVLLVFFL